MDAEDFHRSRRRGRGAGELTAKGAKEYPSEDLSDSELRRRRSYTPSEELTDVDPATGKDKPGSQGRVEGRRRRMADDAGGGRSGGQGAEGTCAGCGRCNLCGRTASPNENKAMDSRNPKEDSGYSEEGGAAAGGSGGRGAGRGRRRGRGGSGHGTSESSVEREYRSSPDRGRDAHSNYRDRRKDRGRSGGHERDRGRGRGRELTETGHRSDPSGGRGDRGAARRRRDPQQERGSRNEHGYNRHRRTDRLGGNPRSGGRRDLRGPGVETGYSSSELSSLGDEDASPRRRPPRRETAAGAATAAAAAAVANRTSARESSLRAFRKSGGAARLRARDDRGGDAAFSTPFSTPRRQAAAAPARQGHPTWRDSLRGGRGRRAGGPDSGVSDGGDSGLHGYPSLPPAVLSEGRRARPGDLFAGGGGGGGGKEWQPDGDAGRRRARRRAREVRME